MFITSQDNAGKIIFLHFARLEEFLDYNKNHPIIFGTSLYASLYFLFLFLVFIILLIIVYLYFILKFTVD